MWLLTTYRHTALFSLRSSMATSSGGKTNLVPSMYSIKMAILDAAFRMGLDGADIFPWVRDLEIRFEPPAHAVVNNSFIKVLSEPKARNEKGPAFISTVGYREFVSYEGDLCVAIHTGSLQEQQLATLKNILFHINYFGKRGSFVQALGQELQEELGATFSTVLGEKGTTSSAVMVQYLDDMGKKATFESISSFSDAKASLGRERVMKTVFLPYRMKTSSRGYTMYSR